MGDNRQVVGNFWQCALSQQMRFITESHNLKIPLIYHPRTYLLASYEIIDFNVFLIHSLKQAFPAVQKTLEL